MKTRSLLIGVALIAAGMASAACVTGSPGPGTVRREVDIVEHGSAATALERLLDSADLRAGDVLRVRQGGEALMDFGDRMLLRLFNDTRTRVESATEHGVPLDVQMFLEEGGFTGDLKQSGGRAVFDTPGGVEITILGTEFFVVYDPASSLTSVGNFHGTVQVASAGVRVSVAPGMRVEVPSGQPPGRQQPLASRARNSSDRPASWHPSSKPPNRL